MGDHKMIFERDLTLKQAMEFVSAYPSEIQYMVDPPESLCLAAVRKDGMALRFIKNQTVDICLAAIHQNYEARKFVKPGIFGPSNNDAGLLDFAAKVLGKGTMDRIKGASLSVAARKILDRWALNEPENLKALETKLGQMAVINRALAQEQKESEVLDGEQGMQMLNNGLARHEVLDLFGIDTRLGKV